MRCDVISKKVKLIIQIKLRTILYVMVVAVDGFNGHNDRVSSLHGSPVGRF